MTIENARFAADGATILATIDGIAMTIPADPANRHRRAIDDWIAAGGTVAPDEAPAGRRTVAKSTIIARLTDAELDAALSVMTTRQKERWRAPDHPAVDAADPELLAVLDAIGADPSVVLA
jgi:hypothetical protein